MNKLFGAVVLGLVSGAAVAGDYLPMSGADVARFSTAAQTVASHEARVLGTEGSNWKLLSDFLGLGETWVWTAAGDEDVWIFNANQNRSYRMANFDAAVGTRWSLRLGPCNNSAKLAQRGETISTQAGSFANTTRLDFTSSCADAGVGSAWFAPGVGLVKWSEASIAGPREFSLMEAEIGGQHYGATSSATVGLELTARFPGPRVLSNVTPSVPVYLELTNASEAPIDLHFGSSQHFEISLLSAEGDVLNTWGANRRFAQFMNTLSIAPGASEVFGGEIDLVSLENGQALDVGTYTLRIEIKGHNTPEASAFTQGSPFAMEAPIYVDRRMSIGN
ncbi:BsuPI-related putative proteinase inhibitor [Pseudomarimonas arenosa]|uniref:Intracellular proteinase inhibitor BsuPI domain-containing protein n=1 Tax=Pseudomarimonas arenosa TaxID=2774145 RepID=A0AAW3ZMH5_9GAMM|nr:BsuPI-related putative proteinase inhibitor [Pseudomarimonas arenosa]MBD8526105.1 hypothetical protein [Pseudomarimonas arenosa]